jgi:hypothetical protein
MEEEEPIDSKSFVIKEMKSDGRSQDHAAMLYDPLERVVNN